MYVLTPGRKVIVQPNTLNDSATGAYKVNSLRINPRPPIR